MTCTCGGNIGFTLAKDTSSNVIILEGCCDICGRTEHGFGITVEQALAIIQRKWKRKEKTS